MANPKWPRKKKIAKLWQHIAWEGVIIPITLALATLVLPLVERQTASVAAQNPPMPTGPASGMVTNSANTSPIQLQPIVTNPAGRLAISLAITVLALLAFISLAHKAWYKRTYDPALVLQFEKEFFGEDMRLQRSKAAAALLVYSQTRDWSKVGNADEIEPVVDFLDNLGFYLYGNQTSERVLHQSFCHWILLYHQDGCDYITLRQTVPEGEKSTWEHVTYLVNEVSEIEAAKQGCRVEALRLSPQKYKKYLLEELAESEESYNDFKKVNPNLFTPGASEAAAAQPKPA